MSYYNISIPFNIIMDYQSLYLKLVTELDDDINTPAMGVDMLELKNTVNIYNLSKRNPKSS
jgi:hypothetical protein